MNDNYLWDRTGEPDQEMQQLEKLLGELRYQPQRLDIPKNFSRRRSFVPGLAIAATLLLALAIGLWLNVNRRSANQPRERLVRDSGSQQLIAPVAENTGTKDQPAPIQSVSKPKTERHQLIARSLAPAKRRRSTTTQPALTTEELAQKEQVLFALRMVSAKLNVAQRKTIGAPPTNIIRNQHKVG
jgi:hypothetical protein